METTAEYPTLRLLSEDAVLVEFEPKVDWNVNGRVRRLLHALDENPPAGFRMALPAYRSLMVMFEPEQVSGDSMLSEVTRALNHSQEMAEPPGRLFRLPTVFGGQYGPDVERVARLAGIGSGEVIDMSANLRLPIYFLGYICSQAYMGGIPTELQAPRHAAPRPLVAGGSFGFGGPQANILAVDSPSGLNYVGRTFVKVFNPATFPPTAFRPGDFVQCYAVDEKTAMAARTAPMEAFIEPICDR